MSISSFCLVATSIPSLLVTYFHSRNPSKCFSEMSIYLTGMVSVVGSITEGPKITGVISFSTSLLPSDTGWNQQKITNWPVVLNMDRRWLQQVFNCEVRQLFFVKKFCHSRPRGGLRQIKAFSEPQSSTFMCPDLLKCLNIVWIIYLLLRTRQSFFPKEVRVNSTQQPSKEKSTLISLTIQENSNH